MFKTTNKMKLSRKQVKPILHLRRSMIRNRWPKLKWEEYISLYIYARCYRFEYGGSPLVSLACFDNWRNRVSIRISENNPFKSRYYEIFGSKSKE